MRQITLKTVAHHLTWTRSGPLSQRDSEINAELAGIADDMQRVQEEADTLRRRLHALAVIVQHTAAWHRERALETGDEEGAPASADDAPASADDRAAGSPRAPAALPP